MTESAAPFEAHKWLEHHAVAMNAMEAGQIRVDDLVKVKIPITITQTGRKAGVLMTTFYRLPDGWPAASGA
ncbi:hypothetical protein ACFW1A_10615 [Kitasatospora sp. NPDC058965]|uniref:hypothetical protein n=1 Tax=Kitasatospora sp. NPDC058965 TaxID=3346682 RepID=UPI0036AD86D4